MKASIVALLALAVLAPVKGFGTPEEMDKFTATYPNSSLSACKICHVKKPALNAYGQDFKLANFDFKMIEGQDSDKDGVSNIDEINKGTMPGDKSDK